MADEKRLAQRVPVADPVELRLEIEGDARFYTGFAQNISSGGLFVQTFTVPKVGTPLRLRFRVAGRDEPIEQPAVVAWTRSASDAANPDDVGFGARFLALPPDLVKLLDRVLAASGPHDFYE